MCQLTATHTDIPYIQAGIGTSACVSAHVNTYRYTIYTDTDSRQHRPTVNHRRCIHGNEQRHKECFLGKAIGGCVCVCVYMGSGWGQLVHVYVATIRGEGRVVDHSYHSTQTSLLSFGCSLRFGGGRYGDQHPSCPIATSSLY